MSRVYKVTGTITAYVVSDETDLKRLEEIGHEVVDEVHEYYGSEDSVAIRIGEVSRIDEVPESDRDKYVFVRSSRYQEDDEVTVEDALTGD